MRPASIRDYNRGPEQKRGEVDRDHTREGRSVSDVLSRIGRRRSQSPRPAIWLMALAASFFVYFFLLLYCDLVRPVNAGFKMEPSPDGYVLVTDVVPGTAATRAGLKVGDRIVSFNGSRIVSVAARSVIGTSAHMDAPLPIVVRREGREVALTMVLERAPRGYWRGRAAVVLLIVRTAQFLTLLSGLFVLWRRPRDPVALAASWFLMTCGVFTIALPWRIATVWREIPEALGVLLFVPYASGLVIGPILLTFVADFPRRVPHARYVQTATWIVAAGALIEPLLNFHDLIYGTRDLRSVGPGSHPLFVVTIISLAASVAIFMANYRRIDDLNERRKVRAVLAGIATGVLSSFPVVAYYWYRQKADLSASIFESPALAFAAVGMLSLPLSITYAVLRHRLFDIGFIIRQGLRYALARRLLLSLLPALVAILVLDLLAHGNKTIYDVLRKRDELGVGGQISHGAGCGDCGNRSEDGLMTPVLQQCRKLRVHGGLDRGDHARGDAVEAAAPSQMFGDIPQQGVAVPMLAEESLVQRVEPALSPERDSERGDGRHCVQ